MMKSTEVFSIFADTKDSCSNNPHEPFQLPIGFTCGFDPNTEFSRSLLKSPVVCVENNPYIITTVQWCSTINGVVTL